MDFVVALEEAEIGYLEIKKNKAGKSERRAALERAPRVGIVRDVVLWIWREVMLGVDFDVSFHMTRYME